MAGAPSLFLPAYFRVGSDGGKILIDYRSAFVSDILSPLHDLVNLRIFSVPVICSGDILHARCRQCVSFFGADLRILPM